MLKIRKRPRIILRKKPRFLIRKKKILKILKSFTIVDLTRFGFVLTGRPCGEVTPLMLSRAIRKWHNTSSPVEKSEAEGVIAQLGWFRPLPLWSEMVLKYAPKEPMNGKAVKPKVPPRRVVIRRVR